LFLVEFAICEYYKRVHVLSRKRLLEAAKAHAELAAPLDAWYRLVKKAEWRTLQDVRGVFASADVVGRFTVFNVKGNTFRLIAEINYGAGRVYIRHVLTHAVYDKGGWKL